MLNIIKFRSVQTKRDIFLSGTTYIVIYLLAFGASSSFAQDIIYTPNDSNVIVLNYFETKERLKEAFNKTTWISYDHIFDDKRNVYKSDVNNIYDLLFYKTKFVFYSSVNSVKEVRSFVFSELKDLHVYTFGENEDKFRYGLALNRINFYWKEKDIKYAKQFVNALYSLKNRKFLQVNIEEELNAFEIIAEQYRKADPKPELSESARKYIIQAITLTKDNNYLEAIKLYQQAIGIEQTIPESHFNLALAYGKVEDYDYAIIEMKKYLMLVPEAKDARAAKDKIYEWEANN